MSRFNVSNVGWSPEALAWLDENWIADKMTTAEMGRVLGCSSDAVIGKAHRRNLPGKRSPIKRHPVETASMPPETAEERAYRLCKQREWAAASRARAREKKGESAAPRPYGVKRARQPKPAPERSALHTVAAVVARLSTAQLAPRMGCCWPLGEPGTQSFRFCGDAQQEASPYCAEHHKLAYIPRRKLPDVIADRRAACQS